MPTANAHCTSRAGPRATSRAESRRCALRSMSASACLTCRRWTSRCRLRALQRAPAPAWSRARWRRRRQPLGGGARLSALPLATLVTAPAKDLKTAAWLVREFAMVQTPGAAAFVALRAQEPASLPAKALIGFGDPVFRYASPGTAPATAPALERAGNASGARHLVRAVSARDASMYSVESGFRYGADPAFARNPRRIDCPRANARRRSENRSRAGCRRNPASRAERTACRPQGRGLRDARSVAGRAARAVETGACNGRDGRIPRTRRCSRSTTCSPSSCVRNGLCFRRAIPPGASATAPPCRASCAGFSSRARAPCLRRTGRWKAAWEASRRLVGQIPPPPPPPPPPLSAIRRDKGGATTLFFRRLLSRLT